MGEGWSTRRASDGVVEYDALDGRGWYRWRAFGPPDKLYVEEQVCPVCDERHAPPFDGACLI